MAIFRQTVAELFNFMPAGPVSCTFMQYSVALCTLLEVASGVISGVIVEVIDVDIVVKFDGSTSNRS